MKIIQKKNCNSYVLKIYYANIFIQSNEKAPKKFNFFIGITPFQFSSINL